MIRTVQPVAPATPPSYCSPSSPAASPAVDVNPVLVFDTRAAVYTKDGNDIVGVIEFFDESRRYKGPTIDISGDKTESSGPYPTVYTGDEGSERLDVVDDDTHAAWSINTDASSSSGDGVSVEEIKARSDKWDDPETVHSDQVGLNHRWGKDYVEDDGDDVVLQHNPCSYYEIRSCSCCRCPDCYDRAKSIRARKNKTPRYACSNPSCDTEGFEQPVRIVENVNDD